MTVSPNHRIETARLTLRPPTLADVDALFAIFGNKQAMRYWSTAPHANKTNTHKMVARWVARSADSIATYGQPLYLVFERTDSIIGCGGFVAGDETGFILRPDHWGKGYGTEAMRALIPVIFERTGLPQLTADVDPRNAASCALLAKLGFHETHRAKNTFCIDGEWADSVYFALKRP
ncbi:ribosomal-protein-alanine N-acetyltransferase [Cognatiyoonia koreensis]|uniref:Ribosomal-protein-alanine N-acetyltransferase n=1 Tax=Cognatiyoonia koreensis TaxID=364200 RepID=A0A1I0PKM0_9RHOB|nr:GNAT family N-acetyltransferase [Cognatiyoonia koreensis]SEW14974.1 ribosomal-protein-alanine N-acetyltransferase [Cognatiyoonia koreensis]